MTVSEAGHFWLGVGAYLGAGLAFGILYILLFAARLDRSAIGASLLFRLVALPGFALVWPLMLVRLLSARVVNRPNDAGEA